MSKLHFSAAKPLRKKRCRQWDTGLEICYPRWCNTWFFRRGKGQCRKPALHLPQFWGLVFFSGFLASFS